MPIKFNLNPGPLSALLNRAGVSDVTEAARVSVENLGTKASDAIACAKLHRAINELEDEIDLQLCDIGRLIYATHIGNPSDSDEIQKILEYVDGLYEEIAAHEQELDLLQGLRFCPACNAENTAANAFCQDCGHPLPATSNHQE